MSQAQSFSCPPRNATAVNILRSWLRAVGVPHQASPVRGCDLQVQAKDGGCVQVRVLMEGPYEALGERVDVSAKAFTGKRKADALGAFYAVLDAAGHDRQEPVDRGGDGPMNENGNLRKLHYRDEDFLVSIRHSEFRRSPNPTEDRWKKYETAMTKIVWKFHQAEGISELCSRISMDIKDLMQIARCLMVNFCARYETEVTLENYNEGRFYRYLRQRFFGDIKDLLERKERSLIPNGEVVRVALGVDDEEISPDPTDAYVTAIDHAKELDETRQILAGESNDDLPEALDEEVDAAYVKRHCKLDLSSNASRRRSASSVLNRLLGALPHDQFIAALTTAAENLDLDYVTRKEALRRLREHTAECSSCDDSDVEIGAQEDEELAGLDSLGADE